VPERRIQQPPDHGLKFEEEKETKEELDQAA